MTEDMDMGATPPEESGNRMFLIGAIILGGIFVVALIAIFALYFLTRTTTPAAPEPQDLTSTALFQAGATQTVAAQGTQTRVAVALQTAAITYTPSLTLTASKSLPQTGFGESAGLPALLLLGGGALLVIILARQLRLGRVRQ